MALLPFASDYWIWTLLRLLFGCGVGISYLAVEYWVVAIAPAERRGREVAFYALAVAVGMSGGPSLLWFTGVEGFWPFLICGGLALLSVVGVTMAWRTAPRSGGVATKLETGIQLLSLRSVATVGCRVFRHDRGWRFRADVELGDRS